MNQKYEEHYKKASSANQSPINIARHSINLIPNMMEKIKEK
jgi:hypothetical protein